MYDSSSKKAHMEKVCQELFIFFCLKLNAWIIPYLRVQNFHHLTAMSLQVLIFHLRLFFLALFLAHYECDPTLFQRQKSDKKKAAKSLQLQSIMCKTTIQRKQYEPALLSPSSTKNGFTDSQVVNKERKLVFAALCCMTIFVVSVVQSQWQRRDRRAISNRYDKV